MLEGYSGTKEQRQQKIFKDEGNRFWKSRTRGDIHSDIKKTMHLLSDTISYDSKRHFGDIHV